MTDLDPPQRPYALAILLELAVDPGIFAPVHAAMGDASPEQRHYDCAEAFTLARAGRPEDDYQHLLLGTCLAEEYEAARGAEAWTLGAVEAARLALKLAPPRPPSWAR